MLEPIKHFLKAQRIILASSSPRRKDILEKNLGLNIEIIPSTFPENLEKTAFSSYAEYAVENSKLKALDVAHNLKNENWLLIIGSDTVIEMDKCLYEKPKDRDDAVQMLKKLSNKVHQVHTGVTLIKKSENSGFEQVSFHETSDVVMCAFDDSIIRAYVESGEPLDKAGSYGIQALGSSLVSSIRGDFFNVEGFPAHRFATELRKFLNL